MIDALPAQVCVVDAQGNIYVFGFTIGGNTARVPVVLRFEARGAPDSRWALGGWHESALRTSEEAA